MRSRIEKSSVRRRRLLLRAAGFLGAAVLLLGGISFMLSTERLSVRNVIAEGNSVVPESLITKETEEILEGKFLGIFPRHNLFLIPESQIENRLKESTVHIASVAVSLDAPDTLRLFIEERTPVYLWCGESKDRPLDPCYFVDTEGVIYKEAPHFSTPTYPILYGVRSKDADVVGSSYLTRESFAKLTELLTFFESYQVTAREIEVRSISEAIIRTKQGFEIRFSLKDPSVLTGSNFETALSSNIISDDLLYVDLRFGNKIFYKNLE